MKKWSGGVLISTLALILLLRYSFMLKPSLTPPLKPPLKPPPPHNKQSVYGFFNNPPNNTSSTSKHSSGGENKPKRPHLIDVQGLTDLYTSLSSNLSKEESKAMLVWARPQMRILLSRSDALPETARGVNEAAIAWKELRSLVDKYINAVKSSDDFVNKDTDCPYFVSAVINSTKSMSGSRVLEIPCGLVEDSSITVIGIPDKEKGSFQIQLIGSKLADQETMAPVVLNYNVILPGENLKKEPVIFQNSWTNDDGWGKEERCPDHRSTNLTDVDGLVKCNARVIRSTVEENSNSSLSNRDKFSNGSSESAHVSANFPFVEGNPFTATLWAGVEGFHMTVNGRHETSFAYREKLEPWLVSGVKLEGGLDLLSGLAKGLPVSENLDLAVNVDHLKAPPISKKRLVMLIGVFSTGNNFERRMALRRSWMQYEAVRSGKVAVRFFIGLNKNTQVNFELWREAQAYEDIQLMPFVDYYSLISLKTIAICTMGTEVLSAKYIMKTDDDAFVRIDEVLSSLKGKDSNGLLYGLISFESEPHRDKDNKWYISTEEWAHSTYPPWAHGPGYIISGDIAKFIVRGHQERDLKLFKLEDVAMGIWIDQFKKHGHIVQYISDDRFYNAGCESNYILAHYQSPRMVLCLWEKLQKEHKPNCCE